MDHLLFEAVFDQKTDKSVFLKIVKNYFRLIRTLCSCRPPIETSGSHLVVSNTDSVIKYVQSDSNCHIGFDWFLARPILERKYCDLTILELPGVPERQLILYASKSWKELSTFNTIIYASAKSADDLYHENLDAITSGIKKTCKEMNEDNSKGNGLSKKRKGKG